MQAGARTYGPLTRRELRQVFRAQRLAHDTPIWSMRSGAWVPACEQPDIAELLKPTLRIRGHLLLAADDCRELWRNRPWTAVFLTAFLLFAGLTVFRATMDVGTQFIAQSALRKLNNELAQSTPTPYPTGQLVQPLLAGSLEQDSMSLAVSTSTPQPASAPVRFTIQSNDFILDNETGLLWQAIGTRLLPPDAARQASQECRWHNRDDWRLPTAEELLELAAALQEHPRIPFTANPPHLFWSSDWYIERLSDRSLPHQVMVNTDLQTTAPFDSQMTSACATRLVRTTKIDRDTRIAGKPALEWAVEHERPGLCEEMLRYSFDLNSLEFKPGLLCRTAGHKETGIAKLLLSNGAYPNLPDSEGDFPLARAVSYINLTVAETLLRAGADPGVGLLNEEPLVVWAANRQEYDLVALLVKGRPELLNALGGDGRTPLQSALYRRDTEAVERLLRLGASPAALDVHGHNALVYTEGQSPRLLELLIQAQGSRR